MESAGELFAEISRFLSDVPFLTTALRLLVILGVGIPVILVLAAQLSRYAQKKLSPQVAMISRKGVRYLGFLLLFLTVLRELGFALTPFLGAAGILGLAVGFASQTSVSNIISGIFLLFERPFAVGDVIDAGGNTGIVLSIDLLSVKMRTFDNRYVRLPNESLIKNPLINITRHPIRRFDLNLGVAYKEDIGRVIEILNEIADRNPWCLDEPAPIIMFTGFGSSELQIFFAVWFAKADFLQLRSTIIREIKERFDAEGIEIPFPHHSIYTGEVTAPFPIRIVTENGSPQPLPSDPEPEAEHPSVERT